MKKIILNILVVLALLLIPNIVNAAATGTSENPYIVVDEEELSAAIEEGGHIRLEENIDVGDFTGAKFTVATDKTVVLDLNGYTLSGKNNDENVSTNLITNNGNLTIKDTSSNKTGKITLDDTKVKLKKWAYGIHTINNCGVLTVNSGIIENTGGTDVPYAIDNNSTVRNVKVTVNGGKIVSKVLGIRAFANSTTKTNEIIINGGNVTGGSSGIWVQQPNANADKATLTINGGTVIGEKYNGAYADINNSVAGEAVTFNITGGKIENNSATGGTLSFLPCSGNLLDNVKINLNITGGEIINKNAEGNALFDIGYIPTNTSNVTVKGGTFSSNVENYIDKNVVICKDVGNAYIVGKEHTIKVEDVDGGDVTVSTTKAIVGETITINVKEQDGYKLVKLTYVPIGETTETNLTSTIAFTMPNKDIEIIAEFEKVTQKVEATNQVEDAEKVEEVLSNTLEDVIKEDTKLAEEIKNKNIVVKVEIEDKKVNNEEKELIKKELKEELKEDIDIVKYIDITIAVKDVESGDKLGELSKIKESIKFTVDLPTDLPEVEEGFTRIYYIVRNHNGKVEILDTELSKDGKELQFSSDLFSTYAIAYKDIENVNSTKDETPKTGIADNFVEIITIIAVVSAGASIYFCKKRR